MSVEPPNGSRQPTGGGEPPVDGGSPWYTQPLFIVGGIAAVIIVIIIIVVVALAWGNGDDGGEEAVQASPSPAMEEPAATTPAGETPTEAPTVEQPTATPEGPTPAAEASPTEAEIDSSNLVTFEEVDEALGEFTTGGPCGPLFCQYETESGIYLRIEQGSPQDFEAGAELIDFRVPGLAEAMQGVKGEPVPGVGDEAAWFDGEVAVLSVHEGNAYFRIVLNLPDVDSAAQLEIAKDLADIAIQRLP